MDLKLIHLFIIVVSVWFHIGSMRSEGKNTQRTTSTTTANVYTPKWNLTPLDYMNMFAPDKVKFLPKNLTSSKTTTTEASSTQETEVTVIEKEESFQYESEEDDTSDGTSDGDVSESSDLLDITTEEDISPITNDDTSTQPYLTNEIISDAVKQSDNASTLSISEISLYNEANTTEKVSSGTPTKSYGTTTLPLANTSPLTTAIIVKSNEGLSNLDSNEKISNTNNSRIMSNITTSNSSEVLIHTKQNPEIKDLIVKNHLLQTAISAKVTNKTKHLSVQSATLAEGSILREAEKLPEQEFNTSMSSIELITMEGVTLEITTSLQMGNISKSVSTTKSELSESTHATSTEFTTPPSAESTSENNSWFKSAIPKFVEDLKKLNGSTINKTNIDYSKFNTKPGTVITTAAPATSPNPPRPSEDKYWSKQKNMSTGMLTGLILMVTLAVACTIASIYVVQWYRHQKTVEDSIALMSDRFGQRRPYYYYDSTM